MRAESAARLGRFLSAKVAWKVDPYLLRASRGRVGLGLGLPTALLETRVAKTGAVRRNAVIYFHDSDRVTIVASKAGAAIACPNGSGRRRPQSVTATQEIRGASRVT